MLKSVKWSMVKISLDVKPILYPSIGFPLKYLNTTILLLAIDARNWNTKNTSLGNNQFSSKSPFLLRCLVCKGAYIKYVGGGAGGFYKFFTKDFVAQETIDLNS